MSIKRITRDDFDVFTIVANPKRVVTSGSLGVTGFVCPFPRASDIEKLPGNVSEYVDDKYSDDTLRSLQLTATSLGTAARRFRTAQANALFSNVMEQYMSRVSSMSEDIRHEARRGVVRWVPSYTYTIDTARKNLVRQNLMPYYRVESSTMQWGFTNYSSLNFIGGHGLPDDSALIYPMVDIGGTTVHEGSYLPAGPFTIGFNINPRYRPGADVEYSPGTIMHVSGTYAVSLVSGSQRDATGQPSSFRVQLQLSSSANISPSLASVSDDMVFVSDDVLLYNTWHNVVIRWGTVDVDGGRGSFIVDGVEKGSFTIPSSSISSPTTAVVHPSVLFIGNYYEGDNGLTPNSDVANFFAVDPALRDGLQELSNTTSIDEPVSWAFTHPLSAEIHDIWMRSIYVNDRELASSFRQAPDELDDTYMLYIPPFFTEESPFRQHVSTHGGILQTPFFEVDGTTNDPFNVALSFGVAGHYMNIENFVKDFANDVWPRLHKLTGSAIPVTTDWSTANEFLYSDPLVVKRNLTIMPCDDGLFTPSFEILYNEVMGDKYVNDIGVTDVSWVSLNNMLSRTSLIFGDAFTSPEDSHVDVEELENELIGFTPESPTLSPGPRFVDYTSKLQKTIVDGTWDPGVQTGAPLTIYQRTRDASSNQVTFFDVSNLLYGRRIMPGSIELSDTSLSGSQGALRITLRDDGAGGLYRADSESTHARWCSVGSVFYNEGVIVIKQPSLYFFGVDEWSLTFRGEQPVNVMSIYAQAGRNEFNSSSNPNFSPLSASVNVNDPDPDNFVYLTGAMFLDDNLNVVARMNLAQPVKKRSSDAVTFKVKIDI